MKPIAADVVLAAQRGDRKAQARVMASMQGFVKRMANRYASGREELFDDLMQAGSLGVLRGLETFRSGRGAPFFTWACFWVRAYCQQARRREEYLPTVSLDAPLTEDADAGALVDVLQADGPTPEDVVAEKDVRAQTRHLMLGTGPSYQRQVLAMRLEGLTYSEVGNRIGRSREFVRLTQKAALERLRPDLKDLS